MTDITILQPGDDVANGSDAVGLLLECAPDSSLRRSHAGAWTLRELIGDFDIAKQRAYDLATQLLAREPRVRGIAQLGIFEEVVVKELQYAFHALHLGRRLRESGIHTCRFLRTSRIATALADLGTAANLGLEVYIPAHRSWGGGIGNSLRRLRATGFSGTRMRAELRTAIDRIDPFRRRSVWRRSPRGRGGLWFYSTAYTYTRVGLLFEPAFPRPLEFMVEDSETGGRPLREIGRAGIDVYRFASWEMAPSHREVGEAVEAITSHLRDTPLSGDEAAAREVLLRSRFAHTFATRLLPAGLFSTALFDRWAEVAQPDALIVGNPVFEGYALHAARRRGIPTILLQHGILGDFCQFIDPPADHYVVRGEFWKAFLAPAARGRAHVLNPEPASPAAGAIQAEHAALVFVTAPYSAHEFLDERDLDEILSALVASAAASGRELVIRVHPLEVVEYYRLRVDGILPSMASAPAVSYSQGPGLDDVLSRATVAVTFSSTVFLDCLRHGVPIISFDWHDFSYRKQIEHEGVFRFARDLAELRALIAAAVGGRLTPFGKDAEAFLATTPDAVIRAELARLTQSCHFG